MAETLNDLITPICEDLGYDVVRILLTGGEKRKSLQIMIERKDRKNLTVDDCAKVSRGLSPMLEEKDPISGNYSLEVSSPGIDRPLIKLDDYDRFKGFEAKVECSSLVNGRKRYNGRLQGIDGENIIIEFEGENVTLPFSEIAKAKLVLTDDLIAASLDTEEEQDN